MATILLMRRLVLILMLLVMSVQWTWAAASSICGHEQQQAAIEHFGHHAHEHEGAAGNVADVDTDTHADCGNCHGASTVLLVPAAEAVPALQAERGATPYRRAVTVGIPERLIRPPHTHLVWHRGEGLSPSPALC